MIKSPEHILQRDIVEKLQDAGILTVGTDVMSGLMLFGKNQVARMRFINHHHKMGYVNGQPDLILLLDGGETLLVELKVNKNKQSSDQEQFEYLAKIRGHNYVVWRSTQDAVDFIRGYRNI
jgi:hypothetical protein